VRIDIPKRVEVSAAAMATPPRKACFADLAALVLSRWSSLGVALNGLAPWRHIDPWSSQGSANDPYQPTKETDMGEHTDKIRGRVKQAIGALTGDHDLKREGERQERKGEVKGHIDDAVDKAKHAADDVKDKIEEAVDKA
jgi:uncharacterized protein YjbJ (UPF0337 family)